jgi:hypothetical protein
LQHNEGQEQNDAPQGSFPDSNRLMPLELMAACTKAVKDLAQRRNPEQEEMLMHQVRRALCVAEQEGVKGDKASLSQLWCAAIIDHDDTWDTLASAQQTDDRAVEDKFKQTLFWHAAWDYAKMCPQQSEQHVPGSIPYTGSARPTRELLELHDRFLRDLGADGYSPEKLALLEKAINNAEEHARDEPEYENEEEANSEYGTPGRLGMGMEMAQ